MNLKNIPSKILPLIITLSAIVLTMFLFLTANKPKPLPPKEISWPVQAVTLEKKSYSPSTIIYGTVESLYNTTLRAGVTGYVQSLTAKEGMQVEKGQQLAQIDPIDAELDVKQKATDLARQNAILDAEKIKHTFDKKIYEEQKKLIDISKSAVDRQQKLARQSVASQANIENAEISLFREIISFNEREQTIKNFKSRMAQLTAESEREKAELAMAQLNLSRTSIKAPFNGRITEKSISIGDRVQNNQELIRLYDIENLEIRAQFPTKDIGVLQLAIEEDYPIVAKLDSPNDKLIIELDRLAGEVNTNQAGIEALFKVQDKNPPLRIGQTVKLKVTFPPKPALISVPFVALYNVSRGYIVYKIVIEDEITNLRAVDVKLVGEYYNEDQEKRMLIQTENLQSGDQVLMTRLPYARDGLRVTIHEEK